MNDKEDAVPGILRTSKGEPYKLCVGCGKALPLTHSFSECMDCWSLVEEGGSG